MDKESKCNAADPTLDELMYVLMTTKKMIQRFMESKIAECDIPAKLSGPRLGVLFAVQKAGSIRMGDLASHLQVTPRTITDLVDALEREGMILRKPHPSDRRATLLELTDTAKVNFQKVKAAKYQYVEKIFEPLGHQERLQLISLLKKIQDGPISELLDTDSDLEE